MKADLKIPLGKWMLLCILPVLLCLVKPVYAQYYVTPPGNSDQPVYNGFGTVNALNNAVFTNPNGTIYAVTFDDGAQNNANLIRFVVIDHCGLSTAYWGITGITTPGTTYSNPDIAMGGDATHTYLGIVYTATVGTNKAVMFEAYEITGVCGTLTVTNCTNSVIKLGGSNNNNADSAHIDVVNTLEQTDNEALFAHNFIVSWQEQSCGTGGWGTKACWGDFSQQATTCNLANMNYVANNSGCINKRNANSFNTWSSDVAAWAQGTAMFSYIDASTGYLDTTRWDFITTNNTSLAYGDVDASTGYIIRQPRIDVNDWPATGSTFYWDIAYQRNNTTLDAMNVNNIATGQQNLTSAYPNTNGSDNVSPVVTAGPSNGGYFAVAYDNPTVDSAYNQIIAWSSGIATMTGSDINYYSMNKAGTDLPGPVAISNNWVRTCPTSCRMDPDSIYVCWYDHSNTRIICKATNSATSPAYKPEPLGMKEITRSGYDKVTDFKMYPNPSNDVLYVNTGEKEMEDYSVSDWMGITVLTGNLKGSSGSIDIRQLPIGNYVLRIVNKDGSHIVTKFTKK